MIEPDQHDLYRSVMRHDHPVVGKIAAGLIEAYNARYVFVVWNGDHVARAMRREDLDWCHPAAAPTLP